MGLIVITFTVLILCGAGAYFGYQAGYYGARRLGGGLFVIVVVMATFFVLARTS